LGGGLFVDDTGGERAGGGGGGGGREDLRMVALLELVRSGFLSLTFSLTIWVKRDPVMREFFRSLGWEEVGRGWEGVGLMLSWLF
jgi:hypothetical protein